MNNAPEKIYVSLHDDWDEPIDLENEMPTEFTTVPYEGPNWVYIRSDLFYRLEEELIDIKQQLKEAC